METHETPPPGGLAAEELWVCEDTLRVRLKHLHPAERGWLRRRLEQEGHDHE
jgi:hypothetical protein